MERPIYRDIHPEDTATLQQGKKTIRYDVIMTVRLDTITRIEHVNGSEYARLVFNDGTECFVTLDKAKAIREELKAEPKRDDDSLAQEVSALTHAVRDLWQLLRQRMR